MDNTIAVLGAQWGDEGKGAVVAHYCKDADICVRAQGGNNAGHTLYTDEGKKIVVNIAPSGIIFPHVTNVIGNGCVVDLEVLANNIEGLDPKLLISDSAHLIFPYHAQLDIARERSRNGGGIGTTGKGIGPAYADKINRVGIRAGLLKHPQRLEQRLREVVEEKNKELPVLCQKNPINIDNLLDSYRPLFERFAPCVADTAEYLHDAGKKGKKIVFEGAQGALLDIDQGTYPHVTSSNTTIGGILTGTGLGLRAIGKVLGVAKAYTSRVGEGIFPTEGEPYADIRSLTRETAGLTDHERGIVQTGNGYNSDYKYFQLVSRYIREVGDEFGSTTGRPRRVGWLDLAVLRKAVRVNGLDYLALTRLDCLDGIGWIYVCDRYGDKERREYFSEFPNNEEDLQNFRPDYSTLGRYRGWESTKSIRNFRDLPKEARHYIELIQDRVGVKVALIKNGCQPHDYIEVEYVFPSRSMTGGVKFL
ncbi:adenylosuccinate synthetase [Candidatus Woesearchaeota archaeon]|nr:adenylosuccinate synthetase [Candidatus Woesearchaeota archaeon]